MKLESRGLVIDTPKGRAKVQIPNVPVAPYSLSLNVEAAGDRSTLLLGVPFGDSRVLIVFDASAGSTIEHKGGGGAMVVSTRRRSFERIDRQTCYAKWNPSELP